MNKLYICIIRMSVLLTIFSITIKIYSQPNLKGTINGIITDSSGKNLQNVSVILLGEKDSSLVKGMISNQTGRYEFSNISSGSYFLNASLLGYKTSLSSTFTIDNGHSKITLPAIKITPEITDLKEVTIISKKPLFEQKIDRMIVNVANSITSAGSTALEVLERSPGIMVDQQNSTLSMNGKGGVVVMINGKINRMPTSAVVQMLAGMSADNIEKIELITTPPANFDAEGNAGYINIVLKSNSQYGTTGSYTLTGGYSTNEVTEASFNINHRNKKINFYADFSISRDHSKQVFEFYNKISNLSDTTESASTANRDVVRLYYSGKSGLDYQLNKKTIIGVFISGYDNKFTNHSNNIGTVTLNHHLDSSVIIVNNEVNDWYNLSGNFNIEHKYSADKKLSFNANYDYYSDNNPNDYLNSFYNKYGIYLNSQNLTSGKKTPINVWVETLDYNTKLAKKVKLETGIKSTVSKFQNNVSIDTIVNNIVLKNLELSGNYYLNENISAAYTSGDIEFSQKTSMKVGFRYEFTNSNLSSLKQQNIVDRHYGNLFPSLFLSHTINDNNAFNIAYSKRITRPTFNDMAPFLIFIDPHTFFSGNEAIQPSKTDAINVSYIFKKKIFSVSYSYEANPITNFTPSIDSLTNTTTYASSNQKDQQTLSVSLSLPFTVNKWWNMQNNFTAVKQQLDAVISNTPLQIENSNFTISSTQSFTLPKNLSLELSGNYFSKALFSIYTVSAFGMLNVGIQKKITKHKSVIRFNASNILNSMTFKPSINLPGENLIGNAMLRFSYPSFKLTFTHNFGNDKVKEKRNRSAGNEEEKARVNN